MAEQDRSPDQPPASVQLVWQLVRFERERQEARWDAVDSKSGVILGFAGVMAALVVTLGDAWFLLASVPVSVAAIFALVAMKAGTYEIQDPEAAYREWASLEPSHASWQAYSDELRTLRANEPAYAQKVKRLRRAWDFLVIGVIVVVMVGLGRSIWPLIEELCGYGG